MYSQSNNSIWRVQITAGFALLLITSLPIPLAAQVNQSFYGATGLSFLPTAQILDRGAFALSYSSKPGVGDEVNLVPYSTHWGYRSRTRGIEFTFTNTYQYASQETGVDVQAIPVPIIPAMKYQLVAMDSSTNYSAMAFGVALPYGAYFAYDKSLWDKLLTLHTGIATKLATYHAFMGLTVRFGRAKRGVQHTTPSRILLEGSWGGSLQDLSMMEESFWAVTYIHQWMPHLALEAYLRFDTAYENRDPVKQMGIGLGYNGILNIRELL